MAKIIIVLTNHEKLGTTGKQTGWYLPEVAHPYSVFKKNGYEVTFLSPKGGKAPMDEGSGEAFKEDPVCQKFVAMKDVMTHINDTKKPADITKDICSYQAIFYAGGHGPMFDLWNNDEVANLATKIYENGGIVGAVCHGPVGLVPVKLSNGESIVKGKKVTCFTNTEEDAVQLSKAMPFLLETKLRELGADFERADDWQEKVQVSERLVTGQNPASATAVAEAIVNLVGSQTKASTKKC